MSIIRSVSQQRLARAILAGALGLGTLASASERVSGASTPTVRVRLTQTQFPPTLHKFGFNATWSNEDRENLDAIDAAAAAGAPMASGLLVTKPAPSKFPDPNNDSTLKGLFALVDHAIEARTNGHLNSLRKRVADNDMLNFLQIAGAPNYLEFTFDPDAQKPAHGNWYPLPQELPTLSNAFGTLATAINANDHAPTIWSFWQEPEHTLDKRLDIDSSLSRYLDLYTLVGPELRRRDRDTVIAGMQMNCSSGESNPKMQSETSKFKSLSRLLLARENVHGAPYPLDYLTIQNYRGEHSSTCIKNTRIALAAPRFNTVPLIFNEWDYDIPRNEQRIDRKQHFEQQYNRPQAVQKLAGLLKDLVDQPDLSYVLLMRDVFRSKPLAYQPLSFLNHMSELRRPLEFSGGHSSVDGIAAADDASLQVMLWNSDPVGEQVIDLKLLELPQGLIGPGKVIQVKTLNSKEDKGKWSWEEKITTIKAEQSNPGQDHLVIPSLGFVLISAGQAQSMQRLTQARYLGQKNWIDRGTNNRGEAPHAMGHYEVRTSSLIASADGHSALGMVGVVLGGLTADMSDPNNASLGVEIDASGLGGTLASPALRNINSMAIRMDYLDGDKILASYTYQNGVFSWPKQIAPVGAQQMGVQQMVLQDGTRLLLEVGKHAPKTWATADGRARRMVITLALLAPEGPATVRAHLVDGLMGQ